MTTLGNPSKDIIIFLKNKYHWYTDDNVSKEINKSMSTLPEEKQEEIQQKIEEAQAEDPTIADNSDDVDSIKSTEIAVAKGIDVESVIGKSEARTEDDVVALVNAVS